ncbi:hypothetical protein ACH4FX_30555 [Streptomyces sp. NPDC018019]|uniref:hypothetical protein n=1 Tax=Streptomyces sp. NPDC018019 TaxID=3365030 RepID=UPI003797B38C
MAGEISGAVGTDALPGDEASIGDQARYREPSLHPLVDDGTVQAFRVVTVFRVSEEASVPPLSKWRGKMLVVMPWSVR